MAVCQGRSTSRLWPGKPGEYQVSDVLEGNIQGNKRFLFMSGTKSQDSSGLSFFL